VRLSDGVTTFVERCRLPSKAKIGRLNAVSSANYVAGCVSKILSPSSSVIQGCLLRVQKMRWSGAARM
jgi:hypothetical protein